MTELSSNTNQCLPNILFLLPQYGRNCTTETFESFLHWARFAAEHDIDWNWIVDPGATLISRSRSQLLSMAMELDNWTHAIFIDNDMGFDPLDILKLIVEDKDVIGAKAPVKAYPLVYNTDSNVIEETDTAERVYYIGTGLMVIKYNTVQKMFHDYKDLAFMVPDGHFGEQKWMKSIDFFAPITNGGHYMDDRLYLTEDFAFCKRVADSGLEVWSHKEVKCSHTGPHVFSDEGETKMIERYARKLERTKKTNEN